MSDCFASAKDSVWTYPEDRRKPENVPTCYVLTKDDFAAMCRNRRCGRPETCPFYKRSRAEVR